MYFLVYSKKKVLNGLLIIKCEEEDLIFSFFPLFLLVAVVRQPLTERLHGHRGYCVHQLHTVIS